jgi:hypothetical protein
LQGRSDLVAGGNGRIATRTELGGQTLTPACRGGSRELCMRGGPVDVLRRGATGVLLRMVLSGGSRFGRLGVGEENPFGIRGLGWVVPPIRAKILPGLRRILPNPGSARGDSRVARVDAVARRGGDDPGVGWRTGADPVVAHSSGLAVLVAGRVTGPPGLGGRSFHCGRSCQRLRDSCVFPWSWWWVSRVELVRPRRGAKRS